MSKTAIIEVEQIEFDLSLLSGAQVVVAQDTDTDPDSDDAEDDVDEAEVGEEEGDKEEAADEADDTEAV